MAITSDRYQQVEKALSEDPIIAEMAKEIQDGIEAGHVSQSNFVHSDGSTPRWEFMQRALDEYKKRGGTIESHIGGPARAVLAIVTGRSL